MGVCAEEEQSAGWALGVECFLVPANGGAGGNVIVYAGGSGVDRQIRESAWVALALVKSRLKTLRRLFTGNEVRVGCNSVFVEPRN